MGLETMKQYTEDVKRQAQELIEQTYQRGFKEGYENGVNAGYNTGAEDGYKKGFEEGYSNAEIDYHAQTEDDRQSSYELGLNMAWEAARKMLLNQNQGGMSSSDYKNCFGDANVITLLENISATEAIETIREYEEKKKQEKDESIKVGDEVVNNNGDKGIVLCYYHETDSCGNYKEEWLVVYMSDYDVPQTVTKKRFKKTGKRYDVMSILKKMQEGE